MPNGKAFEQAPEGKPFGGFFVEVIRSLKNE
jgi:hypothetical protein